MSNTSEVRNFGGNVRFRPRSVFTPQTEEELLDILSQNRTGKIRVVGSRHAWSKAIVSTDVLVDMRHFNQVRVERRNGEIFATVGGGCPIKHLLKALNDQDLTTPSIGLITQQTIAGAISTGTHGSGKNSLSHYIESVRIACYTPDGDTAEIREIHDGPELRAARCAVGSLGIIVDVTFRCIPQYLVQEKATFCASIEEALELEHRSPLQQFFLLPHAWRYVAQERSVSQTGKISRSAWIYGWYWFLSLDIGLHLGVVATARWLRSRWWIGVIYRWILPAIVLPRWVVTDRSDRILTMRHELFRHLEIELFVPRSQVVAAAHFVQEVLQIADGTRDQLSPDLDRAIIEHGWGDDLQRLRGTFCHHYPICFRRVLSDDTLISMTAGDEPCWYSISLITYVQPRDAFYGVGEFLARTMAILFQARPHWGKWFPLGGEEVSRLYPLLPSFREVCDRFDPRGVFRNDFVEKTLILPPAPIAKDVS